MAFIIEEAVEKKTLEARFLIRLPCFLLSSRGRRRSVIRGFRENREGGRTLITGRPIVQTTTKVLAKTKGRERERYFPDSALHASQKRFQPFLWYLKHASTNLYRYEPLLIADRWLPSFCGCCDTNSTRLHTSTLSLLLPQRGGPPLSTFEEHPKRGLNAKIFTSFTMAGGDLKIVWIGCDQETHPIKRFFVSVSMALSTCTWFKLARNLHYFYLLFLVFDFKFIGIYVYGYLR